MKKFVEILLAIICNAVALIIVAVVTCVGINEFMKEAGLSMLFTLLAINLGMILGVFLQLIIHEGGHLITGLLSGYRFISFRIGSFVLIKDRDGKYHLRKMKLPGTGGQCLMNPPDVPAGQCPYFWYNCGGGLINIIVGVIAVSLYLFVLPHTIVFYALFMMFGTAGFALAVLNLIPQKTGGVQNDGYNIWDMRMNADARECVYIGLKINALLTQADTYADLPRELVDRVKAMDFTKMDITNASILGGLNYQAILYYADGDEERSRDLQQYILDTQKTIEVYRNEARCECLSYELTHGCNEDKIKALDTKKLREYIKATEIYPARLRLLYVYHHLYTLNEEKAEEALQKLKKSMDTYMIKADVVLELSRVEKIAALSCDSNHE